MRVLLIIACCFALSCSTKKTTAAGSDSSSSNTKPPLYITVLAKWEGSGAHTYQEMGTCAASVTDPTPTCEISIEEARLYFSDVRFTVGSKETSNCEIVSFFPYYYMRSVGAAYTPPGATAAVDCTADPRPLACFGGAAPTIIGSDFFAKYTGRYFLSAVAASANYDIASENSLRVYGGIDVNYLVTNDLVDMATAIPQTGDGKEFIGDVGAGNEFVNHRAICSDRWGHVYYTITLILHDEDLDEEESGTEDDFEDWQ